MLVYSRWISFFACFLLSCCAGTIYCFGLWGNALDPVLNNISLPTSGVSTAETLLYQGALVGNYLPFAGFFYDWRGARFCASIGIILTCMGYLVVWAAVSETLTLQYWQLMVGFFIFGHGSGYLDAVVVTSNSKNFPDSRGTVVGILKAMYGLSASIFTQLYYTSMSQSSFLLACGPGCALVCSIATYFVNEVQPSFRQERRSTQKIKRFYWASLAVILVAVLLFCTSIFRAIKGANSLDITANALVTALMVSIISSVALIVFGTTEGLCWRSIRDGADSDSSEDQSKTNLIEPIMCQDDDVQPKSRSCRLLDAIRTIEFWTLFIVLTCGMGTGLTFIINTPAVSKSLGATKSRRNVLVSLTSLGNAGGRLLAGRISDQFSNRISRPSILMGFLALMATSQFMLAALSEVSILFIAAAFLVGTSYGSFWALSPAIVGDIFGTGSNFARTYSIFGLAPTVGSLLLSSFMASYIYASNKESSSEKYCIGVDCYKNTFLILAAMCSTASLLCIFLRFRTVHLYRE